MLSNAPEGKLLSLVAEGKEIVPDGAPANAESIFTDKLPIHHSCELNADKPVNYRAAIYVDQSGVVREGSVTAAVKGGNYDDSGAEGISIEGSGPDFSAVIANGGKYSLKNAEINLITKSDGKEVCDFVGLGSAVCAFSGGKIRIEDSEINTTGVAKCAVFADDGSDVVIINSKLSALGGTLYDGYENSADFNYMVAPPWVLGIKGNVRGTNLMGEKASTVIVNSDVKSSNWGVLSTDNGKNNLLVVADTELTLAGDGKEADNPYHKTYGSGYGTYLLGADEYFYGVNMNVGTYIGIARDGNGTYRSSKGIVKAVSPTTGEVLYEAQGKGNISVLNSDGFGILVHGHTDLAFTEGTVMNTENAAFLLRCGGINIKVNDGAQINVKDGVLVQVIDDDDALVGVDWSSPIELHFHKEFNEKPGWPSENGQISSMMPPPPPPPFDPPENDDGADEDEMSLLPPSYDINVEISGTSLEGDIFNGSGYYGQKAKQLYLTLGEGGKLKGRVSATETRHVNEKGEQNTHFTINEYYYLGHVENRNFYNGSNDVEVTLNAGSVWTVTGESVLTKLTVNEGATLNGTVAVGGKEIIPVAGETYTGDIIVKP